VLTIVGLPKAFQGHFGIIQRNAIISWTKLSPRPEIILFGQDEGTAEICQELGLRHVPDIACNESGTPLLSDLFAQAQRLATNDLISYVNADIILTGDIMKAVQHFATFAGQFLMVGQRWDLDLGEPWNFHEPEWEERLRTHVLSHGKLHNHDGIDYYVWRRGLWETLPPFAIGRTSWDNWLIYDVRRRGITVIDATDAVMIVHQNHDYSHVASKGGGNWVWLGPEAKRNFQLAGGWDHVFTVWDATHKLLKSRDSDALVFQERTLNFSRDSVTVSAVIETHNNLDYTQLCLEVVQQFTSEPDELIFLDQGSTDGTREYLQTIPESILIDSPAPSGFARGINRALQAAQHDHILLLHQDVMVTHEWLDRMLAVAQSDPDIGIVAPHSNVGKSNQALADIPPGNDLRQLQLFARERASLYAGHGIQVNSASSCCWLINRALVARIGGLDPRFATRSFAEDDYCLRARLAGFRIMIARDAFVHHCNNCTVTGEQENDLKTLASDWAKFKAKWNFSPDLALDKWIATQQAATPTRRELSRYDLALNRGSSTQRIPPPTFNAKRHHVPLFPAAPPRLEPGYERFSRLLHYYNQHDFYGAAEEAREIVNDLDRPDSPYRDDEILLFAGNALLSIGDQDKAQSCYQASFTLARQRFDRTRRDPRAAEEERRFLHLTSVLANNTAVLAYAQGNPVQAEQILQGAAASPVRNEVLELNRQAMAQQQTVLQLQEIQGNGRAVQLSQGPLAQHWRQQGTAAFQDGRFAEALTWFAAVGATQDAGLQDKYDLGMALSQLDRHQEALVLFVEALTMDPTLAVSYLNVGTALFNLGDAAGAEQFFLHARAFDRSLPQLTEQLAAASRKQGETGQSQPDPTYGHLRYLLQLCRPPRLSLCLIVKDEAQSLAQCLRSVQPVVDEMIVVDTGSSDQTIAIAERMGAQVFQYPWQGDCAAARNESLRHATGDWILILDADEQLDPASHSFLRALIARTPIDPEHPQGFVPLILNHCTEEDLVYSYTLRLFPRLPGLQYQGRIHERLQAPVQMQRVVKLAIHHYGYQPEAMTESKRWQRNRDRCLQLAAEQPDNHLLSLYLGYLHMLVGAWQKAREYYEGAIGLATARGVALDQQCYVPDHLSALAVCCHHLNEPDAALHYIDQALQIETDHPHLLIIQGQILSRLERYDDALASYHKALHVETQPVSSNRTAAQSLIAWLPLLGIGDIYAGQGHIEKAMASYEQALKAYPDNPLVLSRMANLYSGRPLLQANESLLPAQVNNWRKSGYLAATAGDHAAAITWYKMVAATPLASARDYHEIGNAHYQLGDYQEALEADLQAIRLAPAHSPSYDYVAVALYEMGDILTAKMFFERAIALNPFSQVPRKNLEVLQRKSDRLSRRELSKHASSHRHMRALLKEPSLRPRLSLCMIVKNEAMCLAECLESAQPVVDEMIIVDTGSTDGTVAIAESFGARVFHFPWTDNFSTARNESLRHATGDWILILDADERLRPESYAALRDIIALPPMISADPVGYILRIVSPVDSKGQEIQEHYTARLFPNLPQLRFSGYIHEQLPLMMLMGRDIVIDHIGYQPAHMASKGKASRNLELLRKAITDEPDAPFHHYNLGLHYNSCQQYELALEQFLQARALQEKHNSPFAWVLDLCDNIARCLLCLDRPDEAAEYCRKGLLLNPEHAGLWVGLGQAYLDKGEYEIALASFQKAHSLEGMPASVGFTFHRDSTWSPLFGIGLVHARQERPELARQFFEQALALSPNNEAIQRQLAELTMSHSVT